MRGIVADGAHEVDLVLDWRALRDGDAAARRLKLGLGRAPIGVRLRLRPPIVWASGVTGESTRDNPQRVLIGDPPKEDTWGTGTGAGCSWTTGSASGAGGAGTGGSGRQRRPRACRAAATR